MRFTVQGLDPTPYQPLFGLSDEALHARGVIRCAVTEENGFPDRVSLQDLPIGRTALLLNHEHLPMAGPYRSRHAIFVEQGAAQAAVIHDEVPDMLRRRLLSVRAFDAHALMVDAEVLQGEALEPWIQRAFANPLVQFLHVHSARRGCYMAEIRRG